jgi:hypothetical protein
MFKPCCSLNDRFSLAMSLGCQPTSQLSLPLASRNVTEIQDADVCMMVFAPSFGLIIMYLCTHLPLGVDEVSG